jgi:hypothetical protein
MIPLRFTDPREILSRLRGKEERTRVRGWKEAAACAQRTQSRRKHQLHRDVVWAGAAPPRPPSCQWSTGARRGSDDIQTAERSNQPRHGTRPPNGAGRIERDRIARPAPFDDTA